MSTGGPRLISALSGRPARLDEAADPIRVHVCRPPAPPASAARRLLVAALLARFLQRRGEAARLEVTPVSGPPRDGVPAAGLAALADRLGAVPRPGGSRFEDDCLAGLTAAPAGGRLVHVGAPLPPEAPERERLAAAGGPAPIWLAVADVAVADGLAEASETGLVQAISTAIDLPLQLTPSGAAAADAWCARVRAALAELEAPRPDGPEPPPDAALAARLVAARTGLYSALDDGFRTDLALEAIAGLAEAVLEPRDGPPPEGQRQEVRRELAAGLDVLALGGLARRAAAGVGR